MAEERSRKIGKLVMKNKLEFNKTLVEKFIIESHIFN